MELVPVSLGIFSLVLLGVLAGVFFGSEKRARIVVTTLAAFMLGIVVAGSDGVLAKPSQQLVDATRATLTSVGRSIGGADEPVASPSP